MTTNLDDRNPTPDLAEDNAFFHLHIHSVNILQPKQIMTAQLILLHIKAIKKS